MAADNEAEAKRRNKEEGNPSVKCNRIFKKEGNLNIYLRPNEAMRLARNILKKAVILIESGWTDGSVQVWNVGKDKDVLSCGLDKAVGPRRKKRPVKVH